MGERGKGRETQRLARVRGTSRYDPRPHRKEREKEGPLRHKPMTIHIDSETSGGATEKGGKRGRHCGLGLTFGSAENESMN